VTIHQKDRHIRKNNEKLTQAEDAIVEITEQQLELNIRRPREISELATVIEGLKQELSKQKADIAVLESEPQRQLTATDHSV
jgi:AmiR/NasT family two-component response regulator